MAANNLYVIISTLQSDKISVQAADASGADLKVELPVVQEALGASLRAEYKGGSESTVTYAKDGRPVVFAVKAIRLVFEAAEDGLDYLRLDRIPAESPLVKRPDAIRALGLPRDLSAVEGTGGAAPYLINQTRGQVRGYNHLALAAPFVRIE